MTSTANSCPQDCGSGKTQDVGTEASSRVIFSLERMVGQSHVREEDRHICKGVP